MGSLRDGLAPRTAAISAAPEPAPPIIVVEMKEGIAVGIFAASARPLVANSRDDLRQNFDRAQLHFFGLAAQTGVGVGAVATIDVQPASDCTRM